MSLISPIQSSKRRISLRVFAALCLSLALLSQALVISTVGMAYKSHVGAGHVPALADSSPVSLPPEPFVSGSTASMTATVTVLASNIAEHVYGLFSDRRMPEGLVLPNSPTFTESVVTRFNSLLAFFAPSNAAATVAASPPPAGSVTFDFDGDGKADIARWQRASGEWKVKKSTDNSVVLTTLGNVTSTIAPGKFDSDAMTDYAVFDAGTWTIGAFRRHDSNNYRLRNIGRQTGDRRL